MTGTAVMKSTFTETTEEGNEALISPRSRLSSLCGFFIIRLPRSQEKVSESRSRGLSRLSGSVRGEGLAQLKTPPGVLREQGFPGLSAPSNELFPVRRRSYHTHAKSPDLRRITQRERGFSSFLPCHRTRPPCASMRPFPCLMCE